MKFIRKGKILKELSNGQWERMLKRFGSGAGRLWASDRRGTAISDNKGWYVSRRV